MSETHERSCFRTTSEPVLAIVGELLSDRMFVRAFVGGRLGALAAAPAGGRYRHAQDAVINCALRSRLSV